MMILRKSKDRGHADHGWLKSYFSFSFADYYDPKFMGFRTLRVINEDWVAPAQGFGEHPHRDMEILTFIVEGELQHKDSMGHEAVIHKGEVQKISAGTGIAHSEFNASEKDTVHLLQIWILPQTTGIKPSYQQVALKDFNKEGLNLIASGKGGKGIIKFEQDIEVYRGYLSQAGSVIYQLKPSRAAWVQMIEGDLIVNGQVLTAGDGLAIEAEPKLDISSKSPAEFLLFDLK
jgi:quercetin 2,3-dioxygenase